MEKEAKKGKGSKPQKKGQKSEPNKDKGGGRAGTWKSFTCNVSPKRIVKIGMKLPQPNAMVRATTMRKVSNGDANLNWKRI